MPHVMPPDHIRAVGETLGLFVVGRSEQQRGGVDRAAGDDDDVRRKLLALILPADNQKDLPDIPENIRNLMKLNFVESMDEVLKIALESEIKALPIPPVEMTQPSEEKLTH